MSSNSASAIRAPFADLLAAALTVFSEPAIAAIDLARTGQTNSFAAGDDGAFQAGIPWPEPRFIVNGGCVIDQLTGLLWLQAPADSRASWDSALAYANGLVACGIDDWRLPNVKELDTLVNAGVYQNPLWLAEVGFSLPSPPTTFWTSTTVASAPTYAWVISMFNGDLNLQPKSSTALAWPVAGQSTGPAPVWRTGQTTSFAAGDDGAIQAGVVWPSPRFQVMGDCATDGLTGLTWTRNANLLGGTVDWASALSLVAALNSGGGLCGYRDWRLPNRTELSTLVDFSASAPALPADHPFLGVVIADEAPYWTSTSWPINGDTAWIAGLFRGAPGPTNKSGSGSIWPVRGGVLGQAMPPPTGTEVFNYAPADLPVAEPAPSAAMPLGIGHPEFGSIVLRVAFSRFQAPVDIYLGLSAAALGTEILLIRPDLTVASLSSGLIPWRSNTLGPIQELLWGPIDTNQLPAGTYTFYVLVTPAGAMTGYYLWITSFRLS